MSPVSNSASTYLPLPDRLVTFRGFWGDDEATARQLAAIGHVYDRPPLEAIEEGSRCISCSQFVKRDQSIATLEGSYNGSQTGYRDAFQSFQFHSPSCDWLSLRIPLDPQASFGGLYGGYEMHSVKNRWEKRTAAPVSAHPREEKQQTSSLFNLPTELRLQIYSLILPTLASVTEIVPLNRDSSRIATRTGIEKTGPRDLTKTNILRTCKAIHNEALDLLYTNHTYKFTSTKVFPSTKTLYLFLRHIGRSGRALLKAVDIHVVNREDAIAFALLATCPKLRILTLRIPRPTIMFPGAPLWCVEGMAALLELSGVEEVKFAGRDGEASSGRVYLSDGSKDADIVRRELTRAQGEDGGVRWVDGYLDV